MSGHELSFSGSVRVAYPVSTRAMELGGPPLAWFCAAPWPALSPPLTDRRLVAHLEAKRKTRPPGPRLRTRGWGGTVQRGGWIAFLLAAGDNRDDAGLLQHHRFRA